VGLKGFYKAHNIRAVKFDGKVECAAYSAVVSMDGFFEVEIECICLWNVLALDVLLGAHVCKYGFVQFVCDFVDCHSIPLYWLLCGSLALG